MKKERSELKSIIEKLLSKNISITKIRGEASTKRDFFRIFFERKSLVAMVYGAYSPDETDRIIKLTSIYKENGIMVPRIHTVLSGRIIILEDLGNISLQRFYSKGNSVVKKNAEVKLAEILFRILSVPIRYGNGKLDNSRLLSELVFFQNYFVKNFLPGFVKKDEITNDFINLTGKIDNESVFAHRDFHSRNIFVQNDNFYIIDFQDSLIANKYYDMASIVFDSYMKLRSKKDFIGNIESLCGKIDYDQLFLVALQRNIKALGTFGFQIFERGNRSYKKYIGRTLAHIFNNPTIVKFPEVKKTLELISNL